MLAEEIADLPRTEAAKPAAFEGDVPVRGLQEIPGWQSPGLPARDRADRWSDVATEEEKEFIRGTLEACVQQVVKIAMQAHGLGFMYELGDLAVRSVHVVQAATCDDGAVITAPLPLPVPVYGLDFMINVPMVNVDGGVTRPPVTAFIAPGGGSWLAAVEIAPVRPGDENQPAMQPGEEPEPRETGPIPAEASGEDCEPAVKVMPAASRDIAIATVALTVLKRRTRKERLALLLRLTEQEQWQALARKLRGLGVSLLVIYDPATGLCLCASLGQGRPHRWRLDAEYETDRGRLFIDERVSLLNAPSRATTGRLIAGS